MSETDIRRLDVPLDKCRHSRFNTRKTRPADHIQKLAERIGRNGFERTRALWAVESEGWYEVFAGGTRMEAAKLAGLQVVPVVLYANIDEAEVSRRADIDNENDEYHVPVSLLDTWAEYHRLSHEEKWTQQQIATAKGCHQPMVAERIKWHTSLCRIAKQAVYDRLFDEGHCQAISSVSYDVIYFKPWLTTEQAQTELVEEVLGKHRGKTSTDESVKKPSVASVREKAKRWKEMIKLAEECAAKLNERWIKHFVARLAATKARTSAAVNEAYENTVSQQKAESERLAYEARIAVSAAEEEARKASEEEAKAARIRALTDCVKHGDARELIEFAPQGFRLLLTDPPYGMDYQSQRRRVTEKRSKIASDEDAADAVKLLEDVLRQAHARMADDATVLVFTGWRLEPEFRQAVEAAGFTIKGRLIWDKPNHGTGDLKGSFAPKHEAIIHAVKGSPELRRREPDVLTGSEFAGSGHPAEKPVDLLQRLIAATTDEGDVVVDPFAGSGSTVTAAARSKRRFFAIELDENWHRRLVDVVHESATRGESL